MTKHRINIQKLNPNAMLPTYGTPQSAGLDLYACLDAPIIIKPLERAVIPHGFAIELPDGFEVQVRSRSGLAMKNGVIVLNSPGTVDSDYRGEIKTLLINLGQADFVVEHGMRISQMVLARHETVSWVEADISHNTQRGQGGYGSTGI
ncbi:MAG: dUTP diphosphatase [Alphaproteobacteria bacterium]|nr:dUTP diphosphatase [Alphaproteobacteria bacterium]